MKLSSTTRDREELVKSPELEKLNSVTLVAFSRRNHAFFETSSNSCGIILLLNYSCY